MSVAFTEAAGRTAASGLVRGTLLEVALRSDVIGNVAFNGRYRVDGLSETPENRGRRRTPSPADAATPPTPPRRITAKRGEPSSMAAVCIGVRDDG